MKLNDALVTLCVALMIAAPCASVNASNSKSCYGESNWSTVSGDSGQDCGICDSPGTTQQSRTLGTCYWTCFASCYIGNHYTTRSQTVTQNQVSPTQQLICEEQYDETMNGLDLTKDLCQAACFLLEIPLLIAVCEVACILAHEYDESTAMCTRYECKYSCLVDAWTFGGIASGCE